MPIILYNQSASNLVIGTLSKGNGFLDSFEEESRRSLEDGRLMILYGGKYKGYSLEVGLKDNKREGTGYLYTQDNVQIAKLTFVSDRLEGECCLYNNDGLIEYKGYLHDGVLTGPCSQFDETDNEVFFGFFQNGEKYSTLSKVESMPDYWTETRNGSVLSISQYNSKWQKHGHCILYDNGKLFRFVEMVNGSESRVWKEFVGKEMTEYDENGMKRYVGEYDPRIESLFARNGEGTEYEDDGQTRSYTGSWSNNERNGFGIMYHQRHARFRGNWVNGIPEGEGQILSPEGDERVSGKWDCGYLKEKEGELWHYIGGTAKDETISSDADLSQLSAHIRVLIICSNIGNSVTNLDLNKCVALFQLKIQNACFINVNQFDLYGMISLQYIKIGNISFRTN